MTISPAKFVVRDILEQHLPYPSACAELTSLLVEKYDSPVLLDIIDFVSKILYENVELFLPKGKRYTRDSYGLTREKFLEDTFFGTGGAAGMTEMKGPYAPRFARFLNEAKRKAKAGDNRYEKDYIFFEIQTSTGTSLRLSTILTKYQIIDYPIKDRRQIYNEIVRLSMAVLSEDGSQAERRKALDAAYYLISQFCPLYRGSATLAMVYREFLAERADLPTHFLKPQTNLNIETLLTPPETYLQRSRRGSYYDQTATEREILNWQQRAVRHQVAHGTAIA